MKKAKITLRFLGTNGWYDTDTGNTICILADAPAAYVVMDAGNGIYKLDRYIKENKPIFIFISHLHLDHIEGLHILAKFGFRQGINLCIPKGKAKLIRNFINVPFTAPIKDLKYKLRLCEFSREKLPASFLENVLPLRHTGPSYGFRFNFAGKILSYIPDTGLCANAYKLARQADLLITECAFKSGQFNPAWPHLNPESGAKIAKQANVKRLVLAHFDAELYRTIGERKVAEKSARKIFGNVISATDGLSINL